MKLVSLGRQEASLRPPLWASWPSPQVPSHCHTEKHVSLKGDLNCLGALTGRLLAALRCTFAAALQMRCRALVTVPPSQNNWPWGTASQSTQPPSSLSYLIVFTSSSLPPLLPPRKHKPPPDWLVVSKMGLASWPSSLPCLSHSVSSSTTKAFSWWRGPGAQTPPLFSDFKSAPPHICHVVWVIPVPSLNEVTLIVKHHVPGWTLAGGSVYLQVTRCTVQPQWTQSQAKVWKTKACLYTCVED